MPLEAVDILGRERLELQLLALPTMPCLPVALDADPMPMIAFTAPVNLAGNPALALPVPAGGRLPASLQLVGPMGGEELLVAAGAVVEAAVGS